ncbi:hypothetical protein ACIP5Y_07065 [Nocardia sp. NPDC088792]
MKKAKDSGGEDGSADEPLIDTERAEVAPLQTENVELKTQVA